MKTKPPIRWDWIEERWREFTLNNVQIAKKHLELFNREVSEAAIRKRASSYGWQREADQAVRREVRSQLAEGILKLEVRDDETESAGDSPECEESATRKRIEREEITKVKAEAESLVVIAKRQLAEIADARDIATRMSAYVRSQLTLDPDGSANQVFEPGELKDLISAASSAAYTRVRIINTERRIFNMDDKNAGTMNEDGTVTSPTNTFIPLVNLNVTVNRAVRADPIESEPEPAGTMG